MQVIMFQSGQGDCLLLTDAARKTRILVDGGMPDAYSAHVAPALTTFRTAMKKNIDLVYVSHIDEDHIGGVLRMLDDEVLWRVHLHQKANGNPAHKPPQAPRPPEISAIWHNSFHDQVDKNSKPIEEALAASAPLLSASKIEQVRNAGRQQAGIVSSIRQAIRVSRRISPKQLKIPLNGHASGRLLMHRAGQSPINIGNFIVTILGPMRKHLTKLRDDWNTWLEDNQKAVNELREKARQDEKRLGASELDRLLAIMALQAEALGNPKQVTPPNLASLTLLVEEGGTSILLTGDATWQQVIEGLEATGRLQPGQSMNVDVLKVPHHGAEHNVGETDLFDRVIGRHYVFCGNGHSHNPDTRVVEAMVKHRLKAPGKFKLWFNSSEAVVEEPAFAEHMKEVQKVTKRLAANSSGRMTFKFLEAGSSLRVV
jgi:beta-lactamase superfamily II metal-dependent hydrolase